jgi:hypothetical protein
MRQERLDKFLKPEPVTVITSRAGDMAATKAGRTELVAMASVTSTSLRASTELVNHVEPPSMLMATALRLPFSCEKDGRMHFALLPISETTASATVEGAALKRQRVALCEKSLPWSSSELSPAETKVGVT